MEIFDIMHVSIQDMMLICEINAQGSVSGAAMTVRVTQPTASYRLNKLRESFGDQIFINTNRRMQPTALGLRMTEIFGAHLNSVKTLIEPESFTSHLTQRRFNIISEGWFFPALLQNLPAAFFAETRDAKLSIKPRGGETPVNQQLLEHADFYYCTYEAQGAKGTRRLVSPELKVEVFYDPNFRDAPDTLEAFADSRFVMLGTEHSAPSWIDLELARNGYGYRKAACFSPSIDSATDLIKGTDLITCALRLISNSPNYALATTEIPFKAAGVRHEVRWSISKEKDEGHAWLAAIIAEAMKMSAPPSMRMNPTEDFVVLNEYETLSD